MHREGDRRYKKGELVSVEKVILPVGERAPQVPDDTKRTPLRAFTKGFLQEESAKRGDTVTVRTMSDRLVEGTLSGRSISPTHTFGGHVPELTTVHRQVFELMFGGESK
ncbi:MAG: 2-amino-4-oxopentanoate thiolase subunit OrtA [Saccharofermentanales bacterium]